jgi:hypothetical protein
MIKWRSGYIKNQNSVARGRERTVPTERQPLIGEVSANFCEWKLPRCQRVGYLLLESLSTPEPLFFFCQVAPPLNIE